MEKKKGFFAEFKEFISRGNVMDMAVGVIIGGAFTTIVNSLVNDVLMPFLGFVIGDMNFEDFKIVLTPAVGDAAESAIYYGRFIQNIVNFLLIALVVFILIRTINNFHRRKEKAAEEPAPAPAPEPSEEVVLLREIRDSLKKD